MSTLHEQKALLQARLEELVQTSEEAFQSNPEVLINFDYSQMQYRILELVHLAELLGIALEINPEWNLLLDEIALNPF